MISTAIDISIASRAVGYNLKNENFNPSTPYLPQRIAVIGEANTANQATLDDTPYEATTAKEVGDRYGYGSPLHQIARILKPIYGGGVSCPVVFYPQASDIAATARIYKLGVAVATSVTESATHYVVINGRDNIDGIPYAINLVAGDTQSTVTAKIIAAVNAVLSAPVVSSLSTLDVDFTTKWKGLTASNLDIRIDTNGTPAGVVYSQVSNTGGTGVVSLYYLMQDFGENWNTIIVNPYSDQLANLETYNGTIGATVPSGRYLSTVWKPFIALFGNTASTKSALVAITDATARKSQVTNVLCPAPNSEAYPWEAAANAAVLCATVAGSTPHLGIAGKSYPDMPVPTDEIIDEMASLDDRNYLMQHGCSTVTITNGKYTIQDFITTYHPDGDVVPKFKFVRDLIDDWNCAYKWKLIMIRDIQDKTITSDAIPVRVDNTISPKQIKSLLIGHIQDCAQLALITDTQFSIASITVGVNGTAPFRLDISFRYKRTSTANQVSTDAAVDFSYSS